VLVGRLSAGVTLPRCFSTVLRTITKRKFHRLLAATCSIGTDLYLCMRHCYGANYLSGDARFIVRIPARHHA